MTLPISTDYGDVSDHDSWVPEIGSRDVATDMLRGLESQGGFITTGKLRIYCLEGRFHKYLVEPGYVDQVGNGYQINDEGRAHLMTAEVMLD